MKLVPNLLVSVDPGLRACGVSVFEKGKLVRATLVRNHVDGDGAMVCAGMAKSVHDYLHQNSIGYPDVLIVEQMHVYPKQKANPDDLITVATVVGGVLALVDAADKKVVKGKEWTKGVKKEIQNTRTRQKLTDVETTALDVEVPPYLQHNMIDSVGIGLWELKR